MGRGFLARFTASICPCTTLIVLDVLDAARNGRVVFPVPNVCVQRNVIDQSCRLLEHRAVPPDPVGAEVRRAARDQFDRRVVPPHGLAGLEPRTSRSPRRSCAPSATSRPVRCPGPTPSRRKVFPARSCGADRPVSLPVSVAVFHPVAGVFDAAQTGIDADIRPHAQALAVLQKLIRPKAVRFDSAPGVVGRAGAGP